MFSGSTLTLQPGDYYFTTLEIEPQAVVHLLNAKEPVRIFVRERFYYHGLFEEEATGGMAANLLVVYLGSQQTNLFVPFTGTIFAPNAELVLDTLQEGEVHKGAFFGHSVIVRPDVQVHHKPFLANLIGDITLSATSVCPTEEVRIDVAPRTGVGDVRLSIDGMPTDHLYMQFPGLPGTREVVVVAKSDGLTEHRVVTLEVADCSDVPEDHAFVRIAPGREGQVVEFRVVNADELPGANRVFVWDFGDGQSMESTYPFIEHSYTESLSVTDTFHVFDATVTVKRDGLPDVVTHKTVPHWNYYAHMKEKGVIP